MVLDTSTPKRDLPTLQEKAAALRKAIAAEVETPDVRIYLFCFTCEVLSRDGTRQVPHRKTCARPKGDSAALAETSVYAETMDLRILGVNDSAPIGTAKRMARTGTYRPWRVDGDLTEHNLRSAVVAILWSWLRGPQDDLF